MLSGEITRRKVTLGRTALGAPVELFNSDKKSQILVIAGHHGTEPEGTILLSSVLRSIENEILKTHVILSLNPDGLLRGTRGNSNGVDLNRNFPTENWTPKRTTYEWNESSRKVTLSPGVKPESESETALLIAFIKKESIKTVVTIHAPLACVDDPQLSPLGKRLSKELALPLVEDIGYPVPGSFGTWGKENDVHVITLELPSKSIREIRRDYSNCIRDLLLGKILA